MNEERGLDMSILDIRFWLATEVGLVVSIIGVLLAMVALLIIVEDKNRSMRLCICVLSGLMTVLLIVNMFDIQDNCLDIPKIEGVDTKIAKSLLIGAGVDSNNILIIGYEGIPVSESDSEVKQQSLSGAHRIEKEELVIELTCIPYDTYIGVPNDPDVSPKNSVTFSTPQSNTTSSGLSLVIEDYEFFTDGFYYKMPIDENSFSFVDFKNGISGHFTYSRELTNQEYENWGHGGKILNANGEERNIDASFFSTSDGVFAVELPEYMPKGDYVYLLYQFINNEYCEARIPFAVDY